MTAQVDVCVVGSANLDLVATAERLPLPGETVLGQGFAEHPGGKGLNQAVAAARAGARTAFVGALGDDAAADALGDVLRGDGIDASGVERLHGVPTGRALIGVSGTGENSIIVVPGANALVRADALPRAAVLLAQLEVPLEVVVAALRAARAAGSVTVLNPAPARRLTADVLALCDVVVPNEHEVELLGGAAALIASGARAVVVTRGAHGAVLVREDGSESVIPPHAVTPVDTTGAGDTFCGCLAARLALGEQIERALGWASVAAAISTTRAGAVPSIPSAAEVSQLLAQR